MDEESTVAVDINTDGTVPGETADTEDVEAIKTELAEAQKKLEQFPNIVARAKKAEADLKELRSKLPKEAEAPQVKNVPDQDLDSRILKSQGMSDELLAALKKVASVTGKSLIDSQTDEVFIAIKDKAEAKETADKASLPASKGSGAAQVKKDTTSPNLSAEEHKELWLKNQGR